MQIGIRELRDGLSRHLAEVRNGEEITVTDHGKPVAMLIPILKENPFARLVAEGVITLPADRAGRSELHAPVEAETDVRLSEIVTELRR